ncbi:unnamed protein product [Lota lota]
MAIERKESASRAIIHPAESSVCGPHLDRRQQAVKRAPLEDDEVSEASPVTVTPMQGRAEAETPPGMTNGLWEQH